MNHSRIFFAKPFHDVKLAPGGSYPYEWFDNKQFNGPTTRYIPLPEAGIYHMSVYEQDAIASPRPPMAFSFICGPTSVPLMEHKLLDNGVKLSVYELHHVLACDSVDRTVSAGFDNDTADIMTVSLRNATLILERLA